VLHLKDELSADCLIVCDDGSGEIADLVCFDLERLQITLCHCKWSGTLKAGTDLKNMNELMSQCCRSRRWAYNPKLVREINDRLSRRRNTKLLAGQRKILADMDSKFYPNEWSFRVLAVQPGTSTDKVLRSRHDSNLNKVLLATYEWLLGANVEFALWGA
jgi:hypothetical protein